MISAPSPDAPRSVTILGATGSVGASTVDLIGRSPERFTVEAVTANKDAERLAAIARQLGARYAAVADEAAYPALKAALSGSGIEAAGGAEAVVAAAARPAEWVMGAIVGAAGLQPILTAIRRGAMVAFANKECLVCAGGLMMAEVRKHGATLLPVDSEHNAIFQVFQPGEKVRRLILTASGGPFREWSRKRMAAATPAQAVAHPNWSMGAKISVDSATMMNKGLELIEASHLFAMPEDRIEIVVHPQSVIHSLVDYADGSVLAQLGVPDMRVPIAYTLAWPERMETPCAALDLARIARLDFQQPDPERFPALRLTRECLRQGGSAATVLNAANEVAVAAFLEGRIGFLDIERIVESTLAMIPAQAVATLDEVFAIDAEARRHAAAL
ncbi:1-deoxy-D-xylulose-5-phosphate reductoisomerase [Inquilinus sp. Marseille-Q2685]|uniref:1-deoxy-D-xylulose-5-phosphate reductoisomerase n=1 Tax=Inquilinus sp. Marseille-Q2685 TaxID=2866581 RepID=UPI001CE3BFB7|nr:1-deoxy-D-xylulose-5-phosphate reductoisomerase [Inquilinus sp. Marseille-Q2685]